MLSIGRRLLSVPSLAGAVGFLEPLLGWTRSYPAAPGRKSGAARIKREAAKRRSRRG